MPRFFMSVRDGKTLTKDQHGAMFADVETVRQEALILARDVLSDRFMRSSGQIKLEYEITDEAGSVVAKIPFRDALN